MSVGFAKLLAIALSSSMAEFADSCEGAGPIRVTVVVVLASSNQKLVDKKLEQLAQEIRKREPGLTGFRAAASLQQSIQVGKSHTFELLEKQSLKVIVDKPKDKEGRVRLTIRPPGLGDITYMCRCDKFFPVVTPHITTEGERLIVVVMAKPCVMK